MANGHLNLNISLMRIPWKILKTWPIGHLNSSKLVMQFGKLCRFSCKLQILASSHTFIANGIRLETADTVPLAA